MLIPHVNTYAG